jgi:hypothetical protein
VTTPKPRPKRQEPGIPYVDPWDQWWGPPPKKKIRPGLDTTDVNKGKRKPTKKVKPRTTKKVGGAQAANRAKRREGKNLRTTTYHKPRTGRRPK